MMLTRPLSNLRSDLSVVNAPLFDGLSIGNVSRSVSAKLVLNADIVAAT